MKLITLAATLAFASHALADDGYVHVVRPGETLASIANHYYGDGKYWPKIIADSSLPGWPRVRPFWVSKRNTNDQKMAATVRPARTAPASWAAI